MQDCSYGVAIWTKVTLSSFNSYKVKILKRQRNKYNHVNKTWQRGSNTQLDKVLALQP